ncbi:MAG: hypothetical protein KDA51_01900, partial [Planctomycetales bacterium]|nr:hypothetical protein [Planctomycetales bacterium]
SDSCAIALRKTFTIQVMPLQNERLLLLAASGRDYKPQRARRGNSGYERSNASSAAIAVRFTSRHTSQ